MTVKADGPTLQCIWGPQSPLVLKGEDGLPETGFGTWFSPVTDTAHVAQLPQAEFSPAAFHIEPAAKIALLRPLREAMPPPPVTAPAVRTGDPQVPKEQVNPPDDASPTFKARLLRAAAQAKGKFDHMRGKCFRTANQIIRWLIGRRVDDFPASESSKGQPLQHLNVLIAMGRLKPGMVIYVSRRPGADPSSTKMAYGPHWFTYLGQDSQGIPRFVDQYSTRQTVESLIQFVPGRKIYQIIDPYAGTRKSG